VVKIASVNIVPATNNNSLLALAHIALADENGEHILSVFNIGLSQNKYGGPDSIYCSLPAAVHRIYDRMGVPRTVFERPIEFSRELWRDVCATVIAEYKKWREQQQEEVVQR
jgi:hypothetical protein